MDPGGDRHLVPVAALQLRNLLAMGAPQTLRLCRRRLELLFQPFNLEPGMGGGGLWVAGQCRETGRQNPGDWKTANGGKGISSCLVFWNFEKLIQRLQPKFRNKKARKNVVNSFGQNIRESKSHQIETSQHTTLIAPTTKEICPNIFTPQKYEQQTLSTSKMCQNPPDMVLDNDHESSPTRTHAPRGRAAHPNPRAADGAGQPDSDTRLRTVRRRAKKAKFGAEDSWI